MGSTRRSLSRGRWWCVLAIAVAIGTGHADASCTRILVQDPTRTTVTSGPSLHGRVVQSGAPLASCTVEVWRNFGLRQPVCLARCTSGADGDFAASIPHGGPVSLAFLGDSVPRPWVLRDVHVPSAG